MATKLTRNRWLATGFWPTALASLIALCVLAPIASLLLSALSSANTQWAHLSRFVIPDAALTTLLLLTGVGVVVAMLGTGAAWLVTAFKFPGRQLLVWALLLPLAVPTYVVAYSYLDLLHPIGPLQSFIRAVLGYSSPREFRLPDARSLPGAILVLGSVLYPYVYLSARHMFLTQPSNLIEAARGLGHGPFSLFFRVALPMARPAVVVGTTLALLETLNDVGASEFLGLQTLTVAIYTTWITRSDLAGAAHIALIMLILVLSLISIERYARRQQRFTNTDQSRTMQPRQLPCWLGLAACLFCLLPVLAGFVIPVLHLSWQASLRLSQTGTVSNILQQAASNTVLVALAVTVCTVTSGLVLAWAARTWSTRRAVTLGQRLARTAAVGYALPGTVLAIGLLTPFALLDSAINHGRQWLSLVTPGLWLLGTVTGLVLACTLRLLAVASGSLEAGFARIPIALDQLARSLGQSPLGVLFRVDLPLLRPALCAAALLVFVETMKELPITLLLRPLGIETLATWLYGEAARGTYEEGSIAALLIVLVSILPVILLTRTHSTVKKSQR